MTVVTAGAKQRIVFLVSGGGGNLRFIHRAIEQGQLPGAELVGVVADRDCPALAYCEARQIPTYVIRYSRAEPEELGAALQELRPDVIVTNIHKILDSKTVGAFSGRMINLHYSLLPLFKGAIGVEPVRLAIEQGCKIVGTTVHYVSEAVDAGEIISQSAIPVSTLNIDRLMSDVFRSGCINLLSAIRNLSDGVKPVLLGSGGFVSPPASLRVEDFAEEFWSSVAASR
ncbi:formyltransferase family protein [Sphingomonas sp. LY54]|uniref:phosphoribosylglycinamide formyltransferase n=1 Tax=Sphingomonas sp. LY54 TaxID=3095343 RepID=UPI002D78860D|nr:formyltransferase family protein [Sphingomonas sp. LY54]WRP27587.1 formyltransferase family protein [Sphingomonas sp. LY54]